MPPWVGPPPWPHQLAAFGRCVELLQAGPGRGLVQMPTGTGKSRVMRALAYLGLSLRRRVILSMPTEEILEQQAQDLRRETKVPFYIDQAARLAPSYALIILATHQTAWRRLDRYDPSAWLLFDECRHSNEHARRNLSTLDRFRDVLGFDASPWTEECEAIYGDRVLYQYGLRQAIADGYLCEYELRPLPDVVPAPRGHELYYCASSEAARDLAHACPGSAYLGHETKDRARIVADFRAGRLRRLYLRLMLVEGFDCRDVATIFIDKESEREEHLYQIVGRGLRRKRDGRGLTVYCRDVEAVQRALDRAG